MKAREGDVIKWSYNGTEYLAEVLAIRDGSYGVHVVYEEIGLHQDWIDDCLVESVFVKKVV